jgi:hypothetical protein
MDNYENTPIIATFVLVMTFALVMIIIGIVIIFKFFVLPNVSDSNNVSDDSNNTYILEYSIDNERYKMEFTPVDISFGDNNSYVQYICDNYNVIVSQCGIIWEDYTNDTAEVFENAQVYLKERMNTRISREEKNNYESNQY